VAKVAPARSVPVLPRLPLALQPGRPAQCKKAAGRCCQETYGTAIHFLDDPVKAAREALNDQKLLFVLHVAGNFEDDKFT
jgi:hypothetical protein